MPAQRLKLGLIGAGRIGRLHAENLTTRIPAAELLAVADPYADAARECAERYDIPEHGQDYQHILQRPDIQAVLICSSTDTHARMIAEAARAGKHVFCEKPISLDLSSIDRALAAAELAGVKLQIGFNRRFDANYRRVRQAVERGEIGQPRMLHLISRDPAPPSLEYIRVSGGLFLDMAIHDFDMARFLVGSEVEEVFVQAAALNDPQIGAAGDVDTALTLLRFRNGVIGTISNSRQAAYGYDQRAELLGSAGAISIENNYPNTAVLGTAQSVSRDLPLHFFLERYTESFVTEMNAFVQAVLHDGPVPVSGADGRMSVLIGLAAGRSLEEHRPVCLSEIASQNRENSL
ncbi:MAG TPA: inositol 2-dehydrogenase [Ktedonobacteraceae bacterium]